MAALSLENLLIFHDRDLKRLTLEEQIAAVPGEMAAVEAKIAAEKQAIDEAKAGWRELEVRKKALETEIKATEEKVEKYRSQQSLVRKNDEYQALTHEIEAAETQIGTLEEDEIKVMFSIDDAKKRFGEAELVLKENIAGHEGRIRMLRERAINLKAELVTALAAAEAARGAVPEPQIRVYDRVARNPGYPVCVPVSAGRCEGCHMKVSAGIEFEARQGEKLITCDQCTRIVYWTT